MAGPGSLRRDALLYAASSLVAGGVAAIAGIPLFREWGRLAVGPYALAAAACMAMAARFERSSRPRAWVAGLVLVGAILVPLGLEVAWRARTGPGFHAQSEAIITEEAARALVGGRNPYDTDYLEGPLSARPLGTKTHFPYLPGMLVFGLPRAALGGQAWTDARLWFLAATLAVVGAALARRPSSPDHRVSAFQWTLLVPTGAILGVTGGDDLPVLGLLLLSFVLAAERRWPGAAVAAGLAAAMKQTAWVVVPFIVVAAARDGKRPAIRVAFTVAAIAGLVVLPFVAWSPAAFVEDALRFPLGLGRQESAAGTPTLGRILVEAFPSVRTALTVVLVAAGLGVWTWLLLAPGRRDAGTAARRAGLAFLAALALAPAARLGYLVYPVSLMAWGWFLREGSVEDRPAGPSLAPRTAGGPS